MTLTVASPTSAPTGRGTPDAAGAARLADDAGGPVADRNLALELVRATEAAAIRASAWIGRGRKNDADAAAVDAMRAFLTTVHLDGTVVIGEGEKDRAPMLFNGEHVGDGLGPVVDIAVDPIDGTSLTAAGRPGALSVLAMSDGGTMLDASSVFYMDKIVGGPEAVGVVDIRQPIEQNLRALAAATGRRVDELRVAVLDRPRHADLIARIRATGAGTRLLLDGDVAGGVQAALPGSPIDLCVGVGGSPEGVITACAITALGGMLQGRLAPRDDAERAAAEAAGLPLDTVLELDDLVAGGSCCFVATGVTDGELVRGVAHGEGVIRTESLVLRSASGTLRRIVSEHRPERWA